MSHETLQALYALDVAEVGEEEAAKRWECIFGGGQFTLTKTHVFSANESYRRKPDIPWPKKIQPDLAAYKAEINRLQARLNQEQPKHEWPDDAPENRPAVKKIDWSKVPYSITRMLHPEHDTDNPLTGWIAWNCDEHTRGNPLPDGLVVEGYDISSEMPWTNNNPHITWKAVRCFRIVGIQEGWE